MPRKQCCSGELGLKKGAWATEEDKKLIAYIQEHGEGGWRDVPQKAGLRRCGKSCRLRWTNYLKPDVRRGEFSFEEEQIIIMLHASRGNKWSDIARHLPKRTDNEIKNYWNTNLKKRLIDQGIDPMTHKPMITYNYHTRPTSPENSNSQNASDQPPQSSVASKTFSKSGSTSRLLNKIATRVSYIKGIISSTMEAGGFTNNAQDHQSHVSMATHALFSPSSLTFYPEHGAELPTVESFQGFTSNRAVLDVGSFTKVNDQEFYFPDILGKLYFDDTNNNNNVGYGRDSHLISDVSSTGMDENTTMTTGMDGLFDDYLMAGGNVYNWFTQNK